MSLVESNKSGKGGLSSSRLKDCRQTSERPSTRVELKSKPTKTNKSSTKDYIDRGPREPPNSYTSESARVSLFSKGPLKSYIPDQKNPTIFSLKYLPKLITEEEVRGKLEKFGKILSFQFKDEKEQPPKPEQRGNFKRAEFSFEDKESEMTFRSVKRIRINGLQVKIGFERDPFESLEGSLAGDDDEVSPPNMKKEKPFPHSIRPTERSYFEQPRISLLIPEDNIRINRRGSLFPFFVLSS